MTDTIKIDGNSVINQGIKGTFVGREVLTCFSMEMDAILELYETDSASRGKLPTWDEVENVYETNCTQCEGEIEYQAEENNYKCVDCGEIYEYETECERPQEIMEWWIVTEFLYDKLKACGHPVLEWGNNYYWGRCCSGQAIQLDCVITEICTEMEILDGQRFDWSKK